MTTEPAADEDVKPIGRRRQNAAARAEVAARRAEAMPARHRQRLAHLANSPAAQPLIEHLDRLKATAKAMAAGDRIEEDQS